MRCDGCHAEGLSLDLVFRRGLDGEYNCKRCKKRSRCPSCRRLCGYLVLQPGGSEQVCQRCVT